MEIEPGIWFPKRMACESLHPMALQQKGQRIRQWRREYTVESVTLHPAHDLAFFQDVPFPNGTIVYELDEDDEITKSYQLGAPPPGAGAAPAPGWTPWRFFVIALMILVIGACVVYFLRRRRAARLAQAAPSTSREHPPTG
jgi:hypothetical protein